MGKKRIIKKAEETLVVKDKKLEKNLKSKSKNFGEGNVYISCSYNNTILTLTDKEGNVIGWTTAGNVGFKGSKKATPFAATKAVEVLVQKAQKFGIEKVRIFVKGVGGGRDSAIRSLATKGLDLISIKDVTPIPHNGCRPKKQRKP